ncbi:hypothetical protein [Fluviicola sp.]|jgi:hypothetical protein|nr:hypothetical protein [Fluviicola sp.]MDR0802752.1 hypothetical protein [Fluviicola sp.]
MKEKLILSIFLVRGDQLQGTPLGPVDRYIEMIYDLFAYMLFDMQKYWN